MWGEPAGAATGKKQRFSDLGGSFRFGHNRSGSDDVGIDQGLRLSDGAFPACLSLCAPSCSGSRHWHKASTILCWFTCVVTFSTWKTSQRLSRISSLGFSELCERQASRNLCYVTWSSIAAGSVQDGLVCAMGCQDPRVLRGWPPIRG